jgi:5'-nucleotidase (lipoprotein e(P4) family)
VAGRARLVIIGWIASSLIVAMLGAAIAADAVPEKDALNATLWVSNSVEYRGNTIGAYELAKIRLDQALADKSWSALAQPGAADKPPAVILDADETILDNGPYEAWLIKTGRDFSSKSWNAWVAAAVAKAVPGAVEFTQYADSKGVKVFYVTNRTADQEEATRKNMAALGFPMGGNTDTFLMVKGREDWTQKKGTRRDFIAKDYRVLLLFGDQYGDFSDDYGGSEADREKSFEANKVHFGHDWIVIANPEYGSFESAPFEANYKLSADERRQRKLDALRAWDGPNE